MTTKRPRRSALFLPASNERAVIKARTLPADVIILDLEDAVAPEAKDQARDRATRAVQEGFGDREVVVRVNALDTRWGEQDCMVIGAASPDAILLPKVSMAESLHDARRAIGDGPNLWAMIETCRGVLDLMTIVNAADATGLSVLVAGTNDLAKEMRCTPGPDRSPLLPALSQIVMVARAAGLDALDGVCNVIDDTVTIEQECRQGVAYGFDGKSLIHPAQIEPANRAFSPSEQDVEHARRVVDAFRQNDEAGALRVDGQMVERLHLDAARRTLAFAKRQ